jgi:tyrosyl-tRNA synthetase
VREGKAPDDVAEMIWKYDTNFPALLVEAFGRSASHWRRQIDQGGVKVNGDPVTAYELPAEALDGALVQAGKRQFVRVHLA